MLITSKSLKADSNEATKICQQDIVDWPGSDVYINYTDKTTNLQSEVLGKFITAEAGVTLNSSKCEMHDKISKECQDCVLSPQEYP